MTVEPTVQGDTRALMRGINRISSARPGPMSWGPNDGHIRFYAANGRVLFQADSTGASVESRGKLTGLTPLLDGIRDKNDQQDTRLTGHDNDVKRIDATNVKQDGRLNSAEGRLDSHDSTLSAHSTRINSAQSRADSAYSRAGDALSAAGTAQSRADSAYSRASTGISNAASAQSSANAAQSRADSAYSRAGTGISDASTAKARADAAYSLASGRATQSQVSSLDSKIDARTTKIAAWIRNAIASSGGGGGGGLPPWTGF